MKSRDEKRFWFATILVLVCLTGGSLAAYLAKADDSFGEELAEDLIEEETGWHIDITPDSPENRNV